MKGILFYLFYPFLYFVALLPFYLVYKISDFFYHMLMLFGYRQDVVIANLRNSFPQKSEEEIQSIKRNFFRYLCDLILETLKTLTMTKQEAKDRCVFHQKDWLDKFHQEGRSIIIVMGHYGNWEWAGPSFTLNSPYQLVVVYQPLSNPYFEKMTSGMRTKFGTQISKVNNTLRDMVSNRNKITATALIADQATSASGGYWTSFLNQDTPVATGPEKIAKKFNYPVVYMNVIRPKRGYYEVIPELMFENPKDTSDGEILEAFTNRLEQEIIKDPTVWLWSHKRWKYKRKVE